MSCLVNPRACNETKLNYLPTARRSARRGRRRAGGPGSPPPLQRGHRVTLFEAGPEIGGQFNLAKRIPGKEEFHETLRYFRTLLGKTGVTLRLNTRVDAQALKAEGFDEVIVAPASSRASPTSPASST